MFFLFAALVSCRKQNVFSLRSIVPGNWSTSSNGEFHVMYFVPYKGHFQALLKDRVLDAYILSRSSVRIEYMDYNFTVSLDNVDGIHPHGFTDVTNTISLDICFLSKNAFEVTVIDKERGKIETWGVIRPHLTEVNRLDILKVIGFFVGLIYVIKSIYRLIYRN